jgi:hypothetical protein
MSGSITWREYITDTGKSYSFQCDKSNAELINVSNGQMLSNRRTSNNSPLLPRYFTPRKIHLRPQFQPNRSISLVFGNPQLLKGYLAENGQHYINQADGSILLITGYTGEKTTYPIYYNQVDSGLTDGQVYQ